MAGRGLAGDEGAGGCKKVTTEFELDRAEYMAFNEAILRSTVGIATNNNTGVGTGTLVSFGARNFVSTAAHVIKGASLPEIRYFLPPSTPLKEHSMRNGLPPIEMAYAGDCLKTDGEPIVDDANDLAAIPLAFSPLMPSYMRFVPIEGCLESIRDRASVLIVGFPVANSAPLDSVNRSSKLGRAVGLTSEHAVFSEAIQTQFVLPSSYDPNTHFLVEYSRMDDGILPFGFSGAAAWCSITSRGSIWAATPVFTGVVTRWVPKTNYNPHLLQITRGAFVKDWFEQRS
jgi:hypothetical protein